MLLKAFRGPDTRTALAAVRAEFGDEAMILQTRRLARSGEEAIEVVAAPGAAVLTFRSRLEGGAPRPRLAVPELVEDSARRVIALVGPTGAGKTTTLIKLALHASAFGRRKVGIVTLDTYRVAGLEQLQTYTDIAGLPLEVVYQPTEVEPAMARLGGCDVVLVDTPGRGPRDRYVGAWEPVLRRLRPDEVHLVLPATIRRDIAVAIREAYAPCGPTHVLLTKLDEVPGEAGVAELAYAVDLPTRWVADGQEVPADLGPGSARILAALGRTPVIGTGATS